MHTLDTRIVHNGGFAEQYSVHQHSNDDVEIEVGPAGTLTDTMLLVPAELRTWLALTLLRDVEASSRGTLSHQIGAAAAEASGDMAFVLAGFARTAQRLEQALGDVMEGMRTGLPPRGVQRFQVIPGGIDGTGARA